MRPQSPLCRHEQEVLDLLAIGAWPHRADSALQDHVTACDGCRTLVTVVDALAEYEARPATPHLPDARLVWHRAQMRARQDAARRAARPLVMAEITAVAVLVVLVLSWTGGMALPVDRLAGLPSAVVAGLVAAARSLPATWQSAAEFARGQEASLAALGRPLLVAAAAGAALLGAAFGLSFLADRSERT